MVTRAGHRIAGARRFLREFGFSRKRLALVHARRAGSDGARELLNSRIPGSLRPRGEGRALLVRDVPALAGDAGRGAWRRSPVGEMACAPHAGSHGRSAAFGALADDGRRQFRTHGRSGSPTFATCPRKTRRKYGRIAIVAGKALQHRAADCPRRSWPRLACAACHGTGARSRGG